MWTNWKYPKGLGHFFKGDEILYNYNNNGIPPKWFGEFVKSHKIPIPFKDYNDYMDK